MNSVEIINGRNYITLNGVKKLARDWHRPEVCHWDAFRSRIKRYRQNQGRYTLDELINRKDLRKPTKDKPIVRVSESQARARDESEKKKWQRISCRIATSRIWMGKGAA